MTEPRGSQARWSAAALLAPTAAAVFTGVTAWTLQHSPATASSSAASAPPVTQPVAPRPSVEPAVVALRGSVSRDALQVARKQRTLAALRLQAAARATAGPAQPVSGSAAGAGTGSPAIQGGTTYGAATAAQPAPAYVPAPAYAPAPVAVNRPVTPAPAPAPAPVVQQPAPAPPPPVHTATGASGAPK